jgi:hypothetical protein
MSERLQTNPNRPGLVRRALILGLLGASATSCSFFRAEIDASGAVVETCDHNNPLTKKSKDEDATVDLKKVTGQITTLHERTLLAGGTLEFTQPADRGERYSSEKLDYGLRADEDNLELRIESNEGLTVDKIQFPFANGSPKEIQLGAIACTDDKIYATVIADYLEDALRATESLAPQKD